MFLTQLPKRMSYRLEIDAAEHPVLVALLVNLPYGGRKRFLLQALELVIQQGQHEGLLAAIGHLPVKGTAVAPVDRVEAVAVVPAKGKPRVVRAAAQEVVSVAPVVVVEVVPAAQEAVEDRGAVVLDPVLADMLRF